MESLDLRVLADAQRWLRDGHAATLVTVVETWGSAPRPPGALLALRDDGLVSGSVSGGCVEDDLVARSRAAALEGAAPGLLTYGVTKEEAARFGLPCGGTLRLVREPLAGPAAWIDALLERTAAHRLVARTLELATGHVTLDDAQRGDGLRFDGVRLTTVFGPRWRLVLIGGGQLSQAVAAMAVMLDFEVLVCEPRSEYALGWPAAAGRVLEGMPDDAVAALRPDPHTAIVALTHDPKLDDMALLEALQSQAFYVGALGSRRNQAARRERLATHFGLTAAQLDRLHGPVGLAIGAATPAEIAMSIVAEIVAVKQRAALGERLPAPRASAGVTP